MRRLLTSTAALSLAFANVQPWPLLAQTLTEDGRVVAVDGTVLCEPTADAACNPGDFVEQATAIANAKAAEQAAADQAAVDQAAAEQAAADQAAAEKAAADQAAADQAAAEQAAAEQAAADKAAADQAAVDQAAADQAAAEQAAADKAAADQAAAEQAAAEQAATEQAAADKAAADQAAAEAAPAEASPAVEEVQAEAPAEEAAEVAPAEEPAAVEPVAEVPAAEAPAAPEVAAEVAPETLTDPATGDVLVVDPATGAAMTEAEAATAAVESEAALDAAQAEIVVQSDGTTVDPSAGLKTEEVVIDPDAVPVDAPVASAVEVETLSEILAAPDAVDPTSLGAAASLIEVPGATERTLLADAPVDQAAVSSVTEVLTAADTRTSAQEFAAAPVALAPGKKNRLSDLEKVGLVALGAFVVGAIINENNKAERRQVVSNTGDRVVVLKPDGTYQVYKDDDAVLRRPGSTVRTETFRDGSTRTIVERRDGSQVVTIRDASGRVLRRAQYDDLGHETVLIDDLYDEDVVIIRDLPKPKKKRLTISTQDENAGLKAALAAREVAKAGRTFSLRQVRDIPQVRALAATIDVESITFVSGSAAITASEAENLAALGGLMQDLLDANPREIFLIEGHTDATGKAAMNLALSDRRAESVALALAEYFDIPPENMIVQGYGESELLIDTQKDERANRRVAARIITPLLRATQ